MGFPPITLNVDLICAWCNKHSSLHKSFALLWKPSSILCLGGQFGIFLVNLPAGKSSV